MSVARLFARLVARLIICLFARLFDCLFSGLFARLFTHFSFMDCCCCNICNVILVWAWLFSYCSFLLRARSRMFVCSSLRSKLLFDSSTCTEMLYRVDKSVYPKDVCIMFIQEFCCKMCTQKQRMMQGVYLEDAARFEPRKCCKMYNRGMCITYSLLIHTGARLEE